MDNKNRKLISLVLRIGVAVFALFLIFKDLSFRQLVHDLSSLRIWILLFAIGIQLATQVIMAFRWWVMLRALGIRIPYLTALQLHFHGLFFNNFLPGSVGGDFIRAWYVTRHHENKRFQSALSVFVDRFTGLAATLVIAVVCYLLFMRQEMFLTKESRQGGSSLSPYREEAIWFLSIMAAALAVILLFPGTRRIAVQSVVKLWKTGRHAMGQLLEVLAIYVRKPWIGPFGIGVTVLLQSLIFFSFWLIGRDLGVSDQMRYYFVFFPLVWVISSVPVSVAGIGILEGGVIILFVAIAGASQESATALALLQRVITIIGTLPGLWIHLRASHLPRPQPEFFIDGKTSIR